MIITAGHKSYEIKEEIELLVFLFYYEYQGQKYYDELLRSYEL